MGQATIFNGQKIKTLKDTLTLNGKSDIISSTVDPTASAVDAPIGSLLINQTSGKLYRKLDPGSSVNWEEVGAGVGGINYILNPSAEVNTTGWATYADAAGTAPVDGTGGSPNVTWTRSTTSPLRGVADFNFAKDAANRQGQGVSYDFTIALADKAKVLSVTFDYEVLSGTYADGDLTVYLIADPAGTPVVIQPAGYTVLSATSGTTMRQRATFQTQATGTSYRLCFHVASTSASAYTLAIDNVVVGPQQTVQGAAITDWVSYTPVFTGMGSGSYTSATGRYRRVGDSYEVQIEAIKDATSGTGAANIACSVPFTIDTSKFDTSSTGSSVCGTFLQSQTAYSGVVLVESINTVSFYTGTATGSFKGSMWLSNSQIGAFFTLPAAGLSSNTVLSQDTDTRVVAFNVVSSAGTGTITASFGTSTAFIPSTVTSLKDSHSAWNASTGIYTVPVSGTYRISGGIKVEGTHAAGGQSYYYWLGVFKNASAPATQQITSNQTAATNPFQKEIPFSFEVACVAGDQLSIKVASSIPSPVYSAISDGQVLSISRLSGPATIAASETVACRYKNSSGTNIPGSAGVFKYTIKDFDTHGFYSTSTGLATIPVSGKYSVTASLASSFQTLGVQQGLIIELYKNSVVHSRLGVVIGNGNGNLYFTTGGDDVQCSAGDTLAVYATWGAGVAVPSFADENFNHISIHRVGN